MMTTATVRFQPRDRLLVRDLFLHRFATRDQLLALGYFRSVPRLNYRLLQLVHVGWVRRITRVDGLGIAQSLYAAGPGAAGWLPECLDIDPQEVAHFCHARGGPLSIEHSVRALDFRLRLVGDAKADCIVAEDWRCELECRHAFQFRQNPASRWRRVLVKPDGYVRLLSGNHAVDCFVEIDLGHVALPRFTKKLKAYEDYRDSGAFSDAYGTTRFTVLTVTVGERRLRHLSSLEASDGLHLVTTWERLSKTSLFAPIWASNRSNDCAPFPLRERLVAP